MENSVPFIETARLQLYKVTKEHCDVNYLRWLHDSEVNKYLETGNYPSTIDGLVNFIESVNKKEVLFLAIHKKDDGKYIGNIKIDNINRLYGLAEYGILLGEKSEWGKGFAKEATIAVLKHCFLRLNLRKIMLGVIGENANAHNMYKKLKFQKEGCYKKHVYRDGHYIDIVRMAIFKDDFIKEFHLP